MILHWGLTFLRWGQVCFPMHLYGLHTCVWENVEKYERLLLWSRRSSVAQISEPKKPLGLIFAQTIVNWRSTKVAKIMVKLTFDRLRQVIFASPCICMGPIYLYGKILRIHILDIACIIQLNWILMMSIRAPSRYKIAKIKLSGLKIQDSRHSHHLANQFSTSLSKPLVALSRNLPCNNKMTSGSNPAKIVQSEIQDGRSGFAPLNKMAARAKIENSSNDISSLANGLISECSYRSVPPIALYQNC